MHELIQSPRLCLRKEHCDTGKIVSLWGKAVQRVADQGFREIPGGVFPEWLTLILHWNQSSGHGEDIPLTVPLPLREPADEVQGG